MNWQDTVLESLPFLLLNGLFPIDNDDKVKGLYSRIDRMRKAAAEVQAEISFKAGMKEVVNNLPRGLFIADMPPEEGKPYSYLGCYILRWGKDDEPTIGLSRLSDNEDWQAQLKSWNI